MQKYSKTKLASIPEKIPVTKYPNQLVKSSMDVLSWIKKEKAVVNDQPLTFEKLGQGNGYVLYRKRFTQPISSGKLKIEGLRDFATVYVNGVKVGELNRVFKNYELTISIPFNGILEILVENMGRINYGAEIVHNTKGIIAPVFINEYEISGGWEMYKMPMNEVPVIKNETIKAGRPVLYESTVNIDKPADTFLDMTNWGKGIVFVNGHNLGRYWKVGPQQTLYVPGCWLKAGENKFVVLEQLNENTPKELIFTDQPILDKLN
jgi:beta-galactosidase